MTRPDHPLIGDRVLYVPNHTNGDRLHPDCELGTVTRVAMPSEGPATVFVLFDDPASMGRSKSCYASDLVIVTHSKGSPDV